MELELDAGAETAMAVVAAAAAVGKGKAGMEVESALPTAPAAEAAATVNPPTIFVASVSPQSTASLAARYGVTMETAANKLAGFLKQLGAWDRVQV
jgi:hypothetical protein